MNRIEQLKYMSYAKSLKKAIADLLTLQPSTYTLETFLDTSSVPCVKVVFNSAFPEHSSEYSEGLPPVDRLEDAKRTHATMFATCINSALKHAANGQTIQDNEYMVILVDGNNLAHRCKHVYKLSHQQQDTSIMYGVLRSLTVLYKKFNPYRIVVAFDNGIPSRRTALVAGYKANRHIDDQDDYQATKAQIDRLYDWLPQFGIFTAKAQGYEADDVIAAFSQYLPKFFQKPNQRNLVVSGDKDLYQLVSAYTHVSDPMAKELITLGNFQEVTGIAIESWLLYRALVGDTSDNIPGIRGIGEVTAKRLVGQYPTPTRLHLAYMKADSADNWKLKVAQAGGFRVIKSMLECIDLLDMVDTYSGAFVEDTEMGITPFRSWSDANDELLRLGMTSLTQDDLFVDMVRKFISRHGLVGNV